MQKKVGKKQSISKSTPAKPAAGESILELDGPFSAPVAKTTLKPKTAATRASKPVATSPLPGVERKAVKPASRVSTRLAIDPFAEVAAKAVDRKRKVSPPSKTVGSEAPTSPVADVKKAAKLVKTSGVKPARGATAEIAASEPLAKVSRVFQALAQVSLPELPRENRARLLMQSPTRAFFYWSLRDDPWKRLHQAFGDQGSYTLVIKLINISSKTEQLDPAEAEGERWFDLEPDTGYRAEIGFYAPNRPYFRIVYSNTIKTPRCSPSPHLASDARWTVPATKFAEVLGVAGFTRDAFDVAMAGDDAAAADRAARSAYRKLTGSEHGLDPVSAEDIRHALVSIATGSVLEDLRFQTTGPMFAALQANAGKLTAAAARSAIGEYFEIGEEEWSEDQAVSGAVFGASLVHFPKTLRTTKSTSRYEPHGSHSVLS